MRGMTTTTDVAGDQRAVTGKLVSARMLPKLFSSLTLSLCQEQGFVGGGFYFKYIP